MARGVWSAWDYLFSGRSLTNTKRNARKRYKRHRGRMANEGEKYTSIAMRRHAKVGARRRRRVHRTHR